MSEMIACCGLVCTDCPTFIATQSDDDEARMKTAAYYKKTYGFDFKPEEINCDGCLSTGGRLIGYCHTCEVRKCCMEKGLVNCSICKEQPCDKLTRFHDFSSFAKECYDRLFSVHP